MKKQSTYFRAKLNNDYILQEVVQGNEDYLMSLKDQWGYKYSNIYKTPKEAKIEAGFLRAQEITRILASSRYITNADSYYVRTEKENYEGELRKTSKWLEPFYEKYPSIFV